MKTLQILMPMGGLGQRFRDAGITTPKPLIDVLGVPMFKRALASYENYTGEKRYIFIIRQDTDEEYGLARQIKQIIPDALIKILNHNTQGAVETCLIAEDYIDPNLPLVIMDCDIAFTADNYFSLINESISTNKFDGLLLSFESNDARYSFAKIDQSNKVIQTAEKKPISRNALMGAYFFTEAKTFLVAAHQLVNQPISEDLKEYFVSIVYNILITEGRSIGLARGEFYCFGTPEELNSYVNKNRTANI